MPTPSIDDDFGRPLSPLPAFPKTSARENLQSRLVDQLGLQPDTAAAIALAVVDPAEVRRSLSRPRLLRVQGGTLTAIEAEVWTAAIAPYIINPRLIAGRPPAIAGTTDSVRLRDAAHDGEMEIEVAGYEQLVNELRMARQKVLATNRTWKDDIRLDGIRQPATIVPVRARFAGTTDSIVRLQSADGSTRTAETHETLDIDEEAVLDTYSIDPRELARLVGEIRQLETLDLDEIEADQAARHRVIRMPSVIIVGVQPAVGSPLTFSRGVRNRLTDTHVDPPKPWGDPAQEAVRADAAVEELLNDAKIDEAKGLWMLGQITPQEAEKEGYDPHFDRRAVLVAREMNLNANRRAISRGFRSQSAKKKLGTADRPHMAAGLIARAFDHKLNERDLNARLSILERTLTLDLFRGPDDYGWEATDKDPDVLRDEALDELDAHGTPGSAAIELGIMGVFHLIANGAMKRESGTFSRIGNGPRDLRSGSQIAAAMMSTPHGIRQLHRAVVDGRAGVAIRAVKADGSIIREATGEEKVLVDDRDSDNWIRFHLTGGPDSDLSGDGDKKETPASPEVQLHLAVVALKKAVGSIDTKVKDVLAVKGDNVPLVITQGVEPTAVDEMIVVLQDTVTQLTVWRHVYSSRATDEVPEFYIDDDAETEEEQVDEG